MRKLYHCALFLCTLSSAMAQSQYQQAADNAFANLNKSGVTSRVLYDRVFPGADLSNFNATIASSANHYVQARAELYGASYNTGNQLTIDELKNLIWQSKQQNIIPIGVTLAHFQVCNTDAIELDANNQYRLRSGYTNSQLYQTSQAVVASVLSTSVGYTGTKVQIPLWATFTNTHATITSVRVDFGENNQVKTLTPGDAPVDVFFISTGEKNLRYNIYLSDGTQRTAVSTLTVGDASGGVTYNAPSNGGPLNPGNKAVSAAYKEPPSFDGFGNIERIAIEADEAFQGYDETSATKGRGNAYIYYAASRGGNNLRKPVIIVDGFDAGDKRGPNEIYGVKLRYLDQSGTQQFLGDDLRSDNSSYQSRPDYNSDVVLLNFPQYAYEYKSKLYCYSSGQCNSVQTPSIRDGGVDYIERNALVLVKLINTVNERLRISGSTEKITLIGPSMGGLISRYALRYMELRGMNANCKLWISFDSPHNGANIPIGAQRFLDYFANGLGQESAKEALNSQINSPAAKQMLIHHYKSDNEAVSGAPAFRDRFVSTLNSFGYPTSACLRKVALVNGSKNGTLQPFGSCQEALYLNGRLSNSASAVTCFLVGIIGGLFGPIGAIGATGLCAVESNRLLEARIYTAPAGSDRCLVTSANITSFNINGPYQKYAIGRGAGQPGNDVLPGGTYNVLGEIADQARTKKWVYRVDVSSYFPQATFIPTVSSYGLYNTSRNWGASLNGINMATETPFDTIYAPNLNEEHVMLTYAGVNFVRRQIGLANQQCVQTPVGGSLTPGCYFIKSQKTGQSLQAMSDGSIQQQGTNGQTNQIWKAEDATGGQFRFTTQDGTSRVATSNTGNFGEGLVLAGYGGSDGQKWSAQQDASNGSYRIYRSSGNTWDLRDFGNQPVLQIWGSTSEPFYDYRSFRFEGATCPGAGSSCDFNIAANTVNAGCNQSVQLTASCGGANCNGITYTWSGNGISQTGQTVTLNAPGSNGSFTYTVTATRAGCGNKTATATINVSGCGGGTTGGLTYNTISYNCTNGQWQLVFTGGDGSPINVHLPGVFANQIFTRDVPRTFTLDQNFWTSGTTFNPTANQSGQQYNNLPSFTSSCTGTPPPPPPPPPSGGLALVNPPTLNCSSGDLTLSTTGGNGQTIEYRIAGLQDWKTSNVFNVPTFMRNGTTFTIQARQSGTEVNPLNYPTSCAGYRFAAVGAEETESGLLIAPNPTHGPFTVRFSLPTKQTATLSVINILGQSVWQREVVGTGQNQTETVDMNRETTGQYVVRLKAANGVKAGKLLLVR